MGKYQVGKTIGEGTFGKVKLAVNTETGEKMAIKVRKKCARIGVVTVYLSAVCKRNGQRLCPHSVHPKHDTNYFDSEHRLWLQTVP